jgi:hypothetical protein
VTDAVPQTCKSSGDCPKGFVCSGGKCVKDKVTDAVPQPAKCGPCDKKNTDGTCTKWQPQCDEKNGWHANTTTCLCEKWIEGKPNGFDPWGHTATTMPLCSADNHCPKDMVCLWGKCVPQYAKQSNSAGSQSSSMTDTGKKDDDPGTGSKSSPVKQPGDTYVRTFTQIPSIPRTPPGTNWDSAPKVSLPAQLPLTPPAQPATQTPPDRKPGEDPDAGSKKLPVTAIPSPSVKPDASLAAQGGLKSLKPGPSIEQNPGSSNGKALKSWEHLVTSKIVPAVVPSPTKPPLKDPDAPYAGSKKLPETAAPKSSAKPGSSSVTQGGLKLQKAGGSIEQDPGSKQRGKTTEDISQKSQRIQGASQTLRGDQPKLFPIQAAPAKVSNPVQQKPTLQSMPMRQASPVRVSNPVQQPSTMKTMPAQVIRRK